MSLSSLSSNENKSTPTRTTLFPSEIHFPPPVVNSYQYGPMPIPPGIPPPPGAAPPVPPPAGVFYQNYREWQPPTGYSIPPPNAYDSQMMYHHVPHPQSYPGPPYTMNSGPYMPPVFSSGPKHASVS